MYEQQYSIDIEHILGRIFDCDRFGVGGLVNSDYIRRQPFSCMMQGLCYQYASADDKKKVEIEEFFSEYSFYSKWDIDTITSFDSSSKTIEKTTWEIEFQNGKEAIEYIISEFQRISDM